MDDIEHHYVALDRYQPGSYVLLANHDEVSTAVFFVHGFWGDSSDTWLDFQWMIDSYSDRFPGWRQSDAYFFRYRSFRQNIDDVAEHLLTFLATFTKGLPSGILDIPEFLKCSGIHLPPRNLLLPERTYKRVLLVGHSEGAIAIRRAVVLHIKRGASENDLILKSKLFLFAPALLGFTPSGLLGTALTITQLNRIIEPALRLSPSYVEMKEGKVLSALKSDTEKLLSERPDLSCLRARVLFGNAEKVVARGEFYGDYPEPPESNRNHITVCKPSPDYIRPLEFVNIQAGESVHG